LYFNTPIKSIAIFALYKYFMQLNYYRFIHKNKKVIHILGITYVYKLLSIFIENEIRLMYHSLRKIFLRKTVIKMDENTIKTLYDNWEDILIKHKEDFELPYATFDAFIKALKIVSFEDGILTLSSPENEAAVNLINKKYLRNLQLTVCEYTGSIINVKIISEINKQNTEDVIPPVPEKKSFVPVHNEDSFRLNPNYTFEKFIVGPNNNLAHTVAVAVAEAPASKYNPLLLYGGVGLGKTHLMQAIAHHIMKTQPEKKVLYVTSETFTNELIDYLRTGKKGHNFRNKYRKIDVLLIDDIQFIIGKDQTQEEFFHTFNDLYQYGKQIVLTSDKPPKDMTLPERLQSRFSEGMICDIQIPSYETKRAILDQKIEDRYLHNIPEDVRDYIANNIKSSIRELEGSINTLQAYADLNKSEITLEVAKTALKDLVSQEHNKIISPELIIDIVAEHYNITVSDLLSKKKSTDYSFPRQVSMYLCRNMTQETSKRVGEALGGRDHSTILHGAKQISNELLTNDNLKNTIEILMKKIDPSLNNV